MANKPEESPAPERKKKPELEPTFPPDVLPDPEIIPQPPEIQPDSSPEINPPPDSPEINWKPSLKLPIYRQWLGQN